MELKPIKAKLEDFKRTEKGVEFYFLDGGSLAEIKLFHEKFDNGKWVKDTEVEKRYHENIENFLSVKESELEKAIGESFDIYCFENRYTFWQPTVYKQFPLTSANKILKGKIHAFQEFDTKGVLIIEHKDDLYKKNFNWSKWMPTLQKSYPSAGLKDNQLKKFKECFNVDWEERDSLIGKEIMFEVKKNNIDKDGKFPTYIEIKKMD